MSIQISFWDATDEHVRKAYAGLGSLKTSNGPDAENYHHRLKMYQVRLLLESSDLAILLASVCPSNH